MRSSYLVQRLKKPHGPLLGGMFRDNPFSFGGGLVNGGLSDDAMTLLRDIFSFDYMGSAEFEWGAVPDALRGLAGDQLTAFTLDVPLAKVPPNRRVKDPKPATGTAPVYVLCRVTQADEVRSSILDFARGKGRTTERVGLDSALRPYNEWDGDVCGWLEIDNGYFFFTSPEMWRATSEMFGVTVSDPAVA